MADTAYSRCLFGAFAIMASSTACINTSAEAGGIADMRLLRSRDWAESGIVDMTTSSACIWALVLFGTKCE